jgi:hypothetical protein
MIRCFPLFLVVGREKVALPPLFVLSVGALLATLTVHRVPCDSVAHDAELGSVRGSLDRGLSDGYKGERVRCTVACGVCNVVCAPPAHLSLKILFVFGSWVFGGEEVET